MRKQSDIKGERNIGIQGVTDSNINVSNRDQNYYISLSWKFFLALVISMFIFNISYKNNKIVNKYTISPTSKTAKKEDKIIKKIVTNNKSSQLNYNQKAQSKKSNNVSIDVEKNEIGGTIIGSVDEVNLSKQNDTTSKLRKNPSKNASIKIGVKSNSGNILGKVGTLNF